MPDITVIRRVDEIVVELAPRGRPGPTGAPGADLSAEVAALEAALAAEEDTRADADALLIPLTQKGAPNGVAALDADELLDDANIPASITRDSELAAETAARQTGDATNAAAIAAELLARAADVDAEENARIAADLLLVPLTQKGAASGVATLDGSGKVPSSQLPAIAITSRTVVASQAAMLALTAEEGDVAIRSDLNKTFILGAGSPTLLASWAEMLTPTDVVTSVDGRVGTVSLSDLYDAAGLAAAALAAAIQRANHTGQQPAASISDLTEAVQDIIGALTGFGGAGLTWVYNDAGDTVGLAVNVDGASLEITADSLNVKALGIVTAMLAANAVTNPKLAPMVTKTYKGRTSGTTGDPEDVPAATLAADLAGQAAFTSTFAPLPAALAVNVFAYRNAVGSPAVSASNSMTCLLLSSQNDEVTYDFVAKAGTYTYRLIHLKGANRAIYDIYVDGTLRGQIDGYNAATGAALTDLTGLTLVGDGAHTLRLVSASRNGASANFVMQIAQQVFLRTGP